MTHQGIKEDANHILWECDKVKRLVTDGEKLTLSARIVRLKELNEYNEREIMWITRYINGDHLK